MDTFKWSEHTPDVSGDPPSPRDCHSAVALPDGRHILVFGGGDSDAEVFFSSLALLDTQTWRWSSPKLQVGHRNSASLTCGTSHAEGAVLGATSSLKLQVGRSQLWLQELSDSCFLLESRVYGGRDGDAGGCVSRAALLGTQTYRWSSSQAASKTCGDVEPGQ